MLIIFVVLCFITMLYTWKINFSIFCYQVKYQSAWVLYKVVSGDALFQDTLGNGLEPPGSLLEEYHLKDETEDIIATLISQGPNGYNHFPNEKEVVISIHCYIFCLYNHILIVLLKTFVQLFVKTKE